MDVKDSNYKKLIDKIDYNNYLLDVNSNLKKTQPRKFQVIRSQTQNNTPIYTRIRNPLNKDINSNVRDNPNIAIQNNNAQKHNYRFIPSIKKEKEEYEPSSISLTSNNTLYKNVMNKNKYQNLTYQNNNNYSVNYTMRDSNYSNISQSVFSTLTTNDRNSKYNYYKVLFHQLKGHNLYLLNQMKKDSNLNEIIKSLEKENKRLKIENQKLKESNNYHANSDGEEDNKRSTLNKANNTYTDKNKKIPEKIQKQIEINNILQQIII